MRKSLSGLLIGVAVFGIVGCGEKEDKVKVFAEDFGAKASKNKVDSLKLLYPGLEADSVALVYNADSISVTDAAEPGAFVISYGSGVIVNVTKSEDGNVTATSSKGIYAFPEKKMEIASQTGMIDESLNDDEIAKRIKDEDFFTYIEKTAKNKKSQMLKIRGGKVTNISDLTIDGSDFTVTKQFTTRGDYFTRGSVTYSNIKGKTLAPGESMHISLVQALMGQESLTGIKWTISDDDFVNRYVKYTGNEYQDYLKNKSEKN